MSETAPGASSPAPGASLSNDKLIDAERRAQEEGWHWEGHMASEGEVIDLLHAFVLATKPEIMVETGTFAGHATKSISEAMERNGKGHLHTIENDKALAGAYEKMNLARTTFINADSTEWAATEAPMNIDIAFIDCGDPPVRLQVVRSLLMKMRDDGLIFVHDTRFYEGFLTALRDILGAPQIDLPTLHGLAIWQT